MVSDVSNSLYSLTNPHSYWLDYYKFLYRVIEEILYFLGVLRKWVSKYSERLFEGL